MNLSLHRSSKTPWSEDQWPSIMLQGWAWAYWKTVNGDRRKSQFLNPWRIQVLPEDTWAYWQRTIIELTFPLPWDMQAQLACLRRSKRKLKDYSKEEIEERSERLVQIPAFIAKKPLESTTQFVDTVEVGRTRTMPCWHFKVRMPSLRPRRCHKGFHSDTFFSDTRSTKEFECGQVLVGAKRSYTYIDMMKGKGYAPSALRNFIRNVAAPSYIHTDNAYEEVLGEWEEVWKTYCIPQMLQNPTINTRKRLREGYRTSREGLDSWCNWMMHQRSIETLLWN